jgi:SAM-dependent MidA family methyltransferase
VGGDGLHRQGVSLSGADFCWRRRPAGERARERVDAIERDLGAGLPVDYTAEYCPSLPAFIDGVACALSRGLIMLADYGLPRRELYHRDRNRGTLMCHYRHRAHEDPFLYPGLQDISAWVDFTAVAEAATAAGLDVSGYTTQANFLLAADVAEEVTAAVAEDSGHRSQAEWAGQLQMLMMPGQMGERFKVMGLSRGVDTVPAGFSGRDLRHLL